MLVKCLCNHCSAYLEFESSEAGKRVDCPHCGMETLLYVPQASPPQPPQATPSLPTPIPKPSPVQAENLSLRRCADCGKEVSVHAELCPHCGAPFVQRRRRGVFFFVFWGVISLMATVVILALGFAVLGGFLSGVGQAVKPERTATPVTAKPVALTPQEKENAQAILRTLRRTMDKVTGTAWLEPEWAADNYRNQMYLYIGVPEEGDPLLRLKIEYEGAETLLIRMYVFRIDDQVETIRPSKMLKTDYVAEKYWEWFDELAERHLLVIKMIAGGNRVLMRYEGSQSQHDRTVSESEKQSLDKMLLVYRFLKEQK